MKTWAAVLALLVGQTPAIAQLWPVAPCVLTNLGRTFSMGNVFPPGASAKLQPVSVGTDLVGFVVAMKDESHWRIVCHRCIGQGRAANGQMWYRTQGDANREADPVRWSADELLGVLDLPQKPLAKPEV